MKQLNHVRLSNANRQGWWDQYMAYQPKKYSHGLNHGQQIIDFPFRNQGVSGEVARQGGTARVDAVFRRCREDGYFLHKWY